jgi:hypothetical protein
LPRTITLCPPPRGAIHARAGDAVLTGPAGEQWPAARARFMDKYRPLGPVEPGADATYLSLPVEVLAVAMTVPFVVHLPDGRSHLAGQPGDWLGDYGDGSLGVVAPAIFSASYEILAAPGKYNGHCGWGDEMRIPEMVEEVRHFVPAHEIRNSFPLDSVSLLDKGSINKPAQFSETVYPGVHSDVGGSYRPGEGGRSDRPGQKLGVIPLADMYSLALAKGETLLPECARKKFNHDDVDVDASLLKTYAH